MSPCAMHVTGQSREERKPPDSRPADEDGGQARGKCAKFCTLGAKEDHFLLRGQEFSGCRCSGWDPEGLWDVFFRIRNAAIPFRRGGAHGTFVKSLPLRPNAKAALLRDINSASRPV